MQLFNGDRPIVHWCNVIMVRVGCNSNDSKHVRWNKAVVQSLEKTWSNTTHARLITFNISSCLSLESKKTWSKLGHVFFRGSHRFCSIIVEILCHCNDDDVQVCLGGLARQGEDADLRIPRGRGAASEPRPRLHFRSGSSQEEPDIEGSVTKKKKNQTKREVFQISDNGRILQVKLW